MRSNLLAKAEKLQSFAYATPDRNRLIGTPGHQATIDWLAKTVNDTGYYDVTVQPFLTPDPNNADLTVDGTTYKASAMDGSPEGTFGGPLAVVANLGCEAVGSPQACEPKHKLIRV